MGVEPYVVAMNGKLFPGADALSAYGGGNAALPNPNGPNGSDYELTLAKPEVQSWKKRAAAGLKQIPTVTAGHGAHGRLQTRLLAGLRSHTDGDECVQITARGRPMQCPGARMSRRASRLIRGRCAPAGCRTPPWRSWRLT